MCYLLQYKLQVPLSQIAFNPIRTRCTSPAAKLSPDSKLVAICADDTLYILDGTTAAKLYKSHNFSDCLSFSLDSTRLLYTSSYEHARALDLKCLPTSVRTESPSCVYPPDRIMIKSQQHDGWYYGRSRTDLVAS
jgi:hypothetical protein